MRESEKLLCVWKDYYVPSIDKWMIVKLIIEVAQFRISLSFPLKNGVQTILYIRPLRSVFLYHLKDHLVHFWKDFSNVSSRFFFYVKCYTLRVLCSFKSDQNSWQSKWKITTLLWQRTFLVFFAAFHCSCLGLNLPDCKPEAVGEGIAIRVSSVQVGNKEMLQRNPKKS